MNLKNSVHHEEHEDHEDFSWRCVILETHRHGDARILCSASFFSRSSCPSWFNYGFKVYRNWIIQSTRQKAHDKIMRLLYYIRFAVAPRPDRALFLCGPMRHA